MLVTGFTLPARTPRTVREVERAAARILAANGLHQGDLIPDTFNRELTTPHAERPMSIVAALNCATTGDPHLPSDLSKAAIAALAHRLLVNELGPYAEDELALAWHVDSWGDVEGRTTESAVAVLEAAADACGVAA
ncbi:hypothetical protein [Streptomyces sp. Je 1-369]|uniref:DUF6197 family protein n=1 Tax=Streptomyces sp. Je 1-369 TaxID=2966192 RepID=UPI002285A8FA|nr:hypothetical protein [Streptomyces sp. Je 1-369]WAL93924.1 hypothetical protein NOO62_05095 [Streptomyces sp. Je 1-369]